MTDNTQSEKNNLQSHEPDKGGTVTEIKVTPKDPESSGPKTSWAGRLALIIALIALVLVIQERYSPQKNAVNSINQTITNTLLPQIKKASGRAETNAVYDLKRIMITLEEIRETSTSEDVITLVDQIQLDLQELSVKLIVHE